MQILEERNSAPLSVNSSPFQQRTFAHADYLFAATSPRHPHPVPVALRQHPPPVPVPFRQQAAMGAMADHQRPRVVVLVAVGYVVSFLVEISSFNRQFSFH